MKSSFTRSRLKAQFAAVLGAAALVIVCAGWLSANEAREERTLTAARVQADAVAFILTQDPAGSGARSGQSPAGDLAWKVVPHHSTDITDRYERRVLSAMHERRLEGNQSPDTYLVDRSAKTIHLVGEREGQLVFVRAQLSPAALPVSHSTLVLLVAAIAAISLVALWTYHCVGNVVALSDYSQALLNARAGAAVEAPELHTDQLQSRNEAHCTAVALSALHRALRLRQLEHH